MRYSEGAGLDTSSVRDVRGRGGFGGGRGLAVGGGGLGVVGLLVVVLLQVLRDGDGGAGAGVGGLSGLGPGQTTDNGRLEQDCRTRADAKGGLFVDAYVIAHEYAHRVQNLLGINRQVTPGESGPTSGTVRLELQADCFAGAWASHAETVPDESGQPLIAEITDDDIARALDAAARIGDDSNQGNLGSGTVDQDAFTHGSSEQRQRW
ncbi:neutral zinc metallopeptidase [Blastococcus sp. HT6-30]|uniref:neutral zinc metallopeptidase n=1 Tax=Blastococcus sp. HT6-30 TaxID=3144843 RepID=UPI00321925B6